MKFPSVLPFERYTAKEGIARNRKFPAAAAGAVLGDLPAPGAEGPERGAGLVLEQQERRASKPTRACASCWKCSPSFARRRAAATARAAPTSAGTARIGTAPAPTAALSMMMMRR